MSLDKRLLDILCCPSTRQPLVPMSADQLDALNRAISGRRIAGVDGALLSDPVSAGLVTRDGRIAYRIEDGIPVLLADQAIHLAQIEGFPA